MSAESTSSPPLDLDRAISECESFLKNQSSGSGHEHTVAQNWLRQLQRTKAEAASSALPPGGEKDSQVKEVAGSKDPRGRSTETRGDTTQIACLLHSEEDPKREFTDGEGAARFQTDLGPIYLHHDHDNELELEHQRMRGSEEYLETAEDMCSRHFKEIFRRTNVAKYDLKAKLIGSFLPFKRGKLEFGRVITSNGITQFESLQPSPMPVEIEDEPRFGFFPSATDGEEPHVASQNPVIGNSVQLYVLRG